MQSASSTYPASVEYQQGHAAVCSAESCYDCTRVHYPPPRDRPSVLLAGGMGSISIRRKCRLAICTVSKSFVLQSIKVLEDLHHSRPVLLSRITGIVSRNELRRWLYLAFSRWPTASAPSAASWNGSEHASSSAWRGLAQPSGKQERGLALRCQTLPVASFLLAQRLSSRPAKQKRRNVPSRSTRRWKGCCEW